MKRIAMVVAFVTAVLHGSTAEAQTLRALERRVTALEQGLAEARRSAPPIGTVIAVALTAAEVRALAPVWVPANGAILNDPVSPLNGRTLPDLIGRFPLGLAPAMDASDNAATTGGSRTLAAPDAEITGVTQGLANRNCTGFMDEAQLAFGGNGLVLDTPVPERACDHTHGINGRFSIRIAELPLPPHRALIYLIKVR